mgnify:CR=1 FL=1
MKKIAFGLVALVWSLGVYPADADDRLDELVIQALERHPGITASDARWQMLRGRARAAGALDDPKLTIGVRSLPVGDPVDFRRDPMTQKVIGISQMIPYRGKRGARADEARNEAEAARWLTEERKLELAQMVRETVYRLYAVDKSSELTQQNLVLLDDLIALAETRYTVGQGSMQEVLQAEVQRSKMQDKLVVLKQQQRSLQALLNELTVRPQSTQTDVVEKPVLVPVSADVDDLVQRAFAARPLLHSLAAEYQARQSSRRLSELDFYPDATLSFEYQQRDTLTSGMAGVGGDDLYSVMLSFNLPLQRDKRRAVQQAATSQSAMVAAQLQQAKNSIERGIAQSLAELDQAFEQANLYREAIIPQGEQALEASVAAYQVGKLDFSLLLKQQMDLFDDRITYHTLIADYHMTRAQLRTLVGGEL